MAGVRQELIRIHKRTITASLNVAWQNRGQIDAQTEWQLREKQTRWCPSSADRACLLQGIDSIRKLPPAGSSVCRSYYLNSELFKVLHSLQTHLMLNFTEKNVNTYFILAVSFYRILPQWSCWSEQLCSFKLHLWDVCAVSELFTETFRKLLVYPSAHCAVDIQY